MSDAQARKAVRADLATRTFIVALIVLVVLTAWGVFLIRSQQVQNAGTLASAKSAATDAKNTADQINSCLTPGGVCYVAAHKQRRQDKAETRSVVILAAACAAGKTGTEALLEAQIRACVLAGLSARSAR